MRASEVASENKTTLRRESSNARDAALERRIAALHAQLSSTSDRAQQRVIAAEMVQLVKRRSPAQVRRMEAARGLR
jgi:hypothetical protein